VFLPDLGDIPDAAMLKLAKKGKAREYALVCVWHQSLSASFKIGTPNEQISWNWGSCF
jgi:hypothetical protein